jgi:hypothetical protein
MSESDKKTAPIIPVIIFMFIPFWNIMMGVLMYLLFVFKLPNIKITIDKIFRIK